MENNFDVNQYMHGYCHYFAIEMAKKYDSKIYLWLDYDKEYQQDFLCHAYTEILPNIYVDALGTFTDINERKNEFNFNEINIFSGTIDEICEKLDEIHVSYREPKVTESIQDFLSKNIVTFEIKENNKLHDVGFGYNFKNKVAIFRRKDNLFANKPILMDEECFINSIVKHKNFKKYKEE